jgi:hypothetical protein
MSHHLPLHPSQLELIVSSKPLIDNNNSAAVPNGGRTWLVTVRTRLDAAYIDLARSASACQLVAAPGKIDTIVQDEADNDQHRTQQLSIKCLGQPDPYTALYSVRETNPVSSCDAQPPKVRVHLRPRYHSATGTAFRLDDRLAALVGRSYLVHPKYALSVVLAYARSHSLDRDRRIDCDPRLESLLGCRWVKKQQLWTRLEALIGRFHEEELSVEHTLNAAAYRTATAELAVACDREANLFPADWNHVGAEDQRAIQKTRTASFNVVKGSSIGDSCGSPSSSRAGSLFRRHKTI